MREEEKKKKCLSLSLFCKHYTQKILSSQLPLQSSSPPHDAGTRLCNYNSFSVRKAESCPGGSSLYRISISPPLSAAAARSLSLSFAASSALSPSPFAGASHAAALPPARAR